MITKFNDAKQKMQLPKFMNCFIQGYQSVLGYNHMGLREDKNLLMKSKFIVLLVKLR